MFFVLAKIFGNLIVPTNLLVILGCCGISLIATRFRAAGIRIMISSIALIGVLGLSPIGDALTIPLETRFPVWSPTQGTPTGIIVLGGVIKARVSAARHQISLNQSAERLTSAVALAREYPNARIVFSGGNGRLVGGRPEGDFALRFFEELGVSGSRVIVERQSRDTAENAIFAKRLIAPKPGERWLLITSAMHMPRAVGAFRQIGFLVEPYPVDYQTAGWQALWSLQDSVMDGLAKTDAAAHEWLGLFVYWVTGRIPVFFPAPR